MSKIKNVIFDLDGTLLDTVKTISYYVNQTLRRHSIPEFTEQQVLRFVGNGPLKLIRRILDERKIYDEEIFEQIYTEFSEAYNGASYYLTVPYDGIAELLWGLADRGIKLAVLSNKQDIATRSVIDSIFPGVFLAVHGGRDGVPLKPCPDGVFEIAKELGAKLSECAFVGDSEVDVQTGINSKVGLNIAVKWGFREPDELISAGAQILADTPEDVFNLIVSHS